MKYIYNSFEFETDLELYRVIVTDIESAYIQECHGICTIFVPINNGFTPRPLTRFPDFSVKIGADTYRIKSLDPVSLTIVQMDDLGETLSNVTPGSVTLISPKVTQDQIRELLNNSNLFELTSSDESEYKYTELINYLINKGVNLNDVTGNHESISLLDTKDRYILDFTHCMYALYDRLRIELDKQKFYLKNQYWTEETDTREVATISFNNYPTDGIRNYVDRGCEFQKSGVDIALTLSTSSVSKFERLLQEYKTFKYLSNIPRIYLEDMTGQIWVASLEWDMTPSTNSPANATNDRNEQSYYITVTARYKFCIVRNNYYQGLRNILITIKHKYHDKSNES